MPGRAVTYEELDREASRMARAVLAAGAAGRPVAILMEKGAAKVAAILGVSRPGRATSRSRPPTLGPGTSRSWRIPGPPWCWPTGPTSRRPPGRGPGRRPGRGGHHGVRAVVFGRGAGPDRRDLARRPRLHLSTPPGPPAGPRGSSRPTGTCCTTSATPPTTSGYSPERHDPLREFVRLQREPEEPVRRPAQRRRAGPLRGRARGRGRPPSGGSSRTRSRSSSRSRPSSASSPRDCPRGSGFPPGPDRPAGRRGGHGPRLRAVPRALPRVVA